MFPAFKRFPVSLRFVGQCLYFLLFWSCIGISFSYQMNYQKESSTQVTLYTLKSVTLNERSRSESIELKMFF